MKYILLCLLFLSGCSLGSYSIGKCYRFIDKDSVKIVKVIAKSSKYVCFSGLKEKACFIGPDLYGTNGGLIECLSNTKKE